jgi:protein ImuB
LAALADNKPFALVGSEERGLVLTAVNAASLDQGLYTGLGLADARAICPQLLTLPAAPRKDGDALLDLARWAACRYSPTLNLDGTDGLWLDVTGVPHLFGGERALLADLERRLAGAGLTARLALVETCGGAHALSRYARRSPLIVPEGSIEAALASLPVEALRLKPEIVTLLRRLGLKRIGQLYALPRASLERRFHSKDTAEAVLLRLDQALGRRKEPRVPLLPEPDFVARLPFLEPLITHDGVLAGIEHLAAELCRKLARAGRGCRRVALWIARADGSSTVIEAGLSAPSREPKHLLRLIEDKVEAIDMGFGVDLMSLSALVTETLPLAQTTLTESDVRTSPVPLIDRLVNRLGARAVRRLVPRASHIPELAQSLKSAFAGPSFWPEQIAKQPRPPLLFARPEPLTVLAEIPEGPPARFTWRRVTRRVVKAEGPERIAPEWWRGLECRDGAASSIPPLDGESGSAEGRAGWGDGALDKRPPTRPATQADFPTRGRYGPSGEMPRTAMISPLPPCGGARARLASAEGGQSQTQNTSLTSLPERHAIATRWAAPTLPHKGGGGASGKRPPRQRDYYRIEDEDGHRYWVFRDGLYQESELGTPSWYLHGVFG